MNSGLPKVHARWWILTCSCIINYGADFFQDVPSVISRRLRGTSAACANATDHCLQMTNMEYNSLSTAFTWSSALSAVATAVIIGHYNIKIALWISSFNMLFGALLFAAGSYADHDIAYPLMLTARIVFGLGNGAALTIISNLISTWFLLHELGVACAINILSGRAGSATVYALVGGVLNRIGMSGCLWIACGLVAAGYIAGMYLGHVQDKRQAEKTGNSVHSLRDVWHIKMVGQTIFQSFGGVFWSFCIVYFLVHGVVATFTSNAQQLLGALEGFTEDAASYTLGLVHDISFVIPLIGLLLDRYGQRQRWLTSGAVVVWFGFMGFLFLPGYIPAGVLTATIGIGFALFDPTASSSTALVSIRDSGGLASTVTKFFRYVAVGLLTTIAGTELDSNAHSSVQQWTAFTGMLTIISFVAVVAAICMDVYNSRDPLLTYRPKDRQLAFQSGMIDEKSSLLPRKNG